MVSVCIFGGGAIGGFIAAHLARSARCAVSVVARGANLAAIQKDGIQVRTPAESFSVRVAATDDPATLGVQDYVFLTLKAQQLDTALPALASIVGPETAILPPTTGLPYYFFHGLEGPYKDRQLDGLDPGGRLWRAMPPEQVLGVVYWIGAHNLGPGMVRQDGASAGCPIGELDGSQSPRVATLAKLLNESGINARLRDDIRGDIWVKFVNSLCWNPVAVLTMARMGEIGGLPDAVGTVRTMMTEADAIAERLGIRVPYAPEKRIAVTLAAPEHKMSMLQDLERGRPLELDILDQSIRAVSAISGLSTPILDTVLALARLRAWIAANPG